MKLFELNDEVSVMTDLHETEILAKSFGFTLNESEMLEEGAIFEWFKKQADAVVGNVSEFFDDFDQVKQISTDAKKAENAGIVINMQTQKGKLKQIYQTINTFSTQLTAYSSTNPTVSKTLNHLNTLFLMGKNALSKISSYVTSKNGFSKLIAAVAFYGFVSKVHEVVVKYRDTIQNYISDDVKDEAKDKLVPHIDKFIREFTDFENIKDQLSGILIKVVGDTTGLSTILTTLKSIGANISDIAAAIAQAVRKINGVNPSPAA